MIALCEYCSPTLMFKAKKEKTLSKIELDKPGLLADMLAGLVLIAAWAAIMLCISVALPPITAGQMLLGAIFGSVLWVAGAIFTAWIEDKSYVTTPIAPETGAGNMLWMLAIPSGIVAITLWLLGFAPAVCWATLVTGYFFAFALTAISMKCGYAQLAFALTGRNEMRQKLIAQF